MESQLKEAYDMQTEFLTFDIVKAAMTDNYALFSQYSSQIAALSMGDALELLNLIDVIFNNRIFEGKHTTCTTKIPATATHIMVSIFQHLLRHGFVANPLIYNSIAQQIVLQCAIASGNTTTLKWIYDNTDIDDALKKALFIDAITEYRPNVNTLGWYLENISNNLDDYLEVQDD